MKEYKVKTENISIGAAIKVQKCLSDTAKTGWILKQIVINEATDQYIIIFEKDF